MVTPLRCRPRNGLLIARTNNRPGVDEAAFRATAIMHGWKHATWSVDSDKTNWYAKFLAASAEQTAHKGRPNFYVHMCRGQWQSVPEVTGSGPFRLSARYSEYEQEWVESMNAVVDAANVWDVWTLLRMIKCEAASKELEKTMGPGGHELLRNILMQVCQHLRSLAR